MSEHSDTPVPPAEPAADSDLDRLAQHIQGPEDQVGMAALWRATMTLPSWWFIAVGEAGEESPAAAQVGDDVLLLAFSSGDRARDFAVSREMIGEDDPLDAIALAPQDVVSSADSYQQASIDGLIFDAHISAFSIPSDQLEPVWKAVMVSDSPEHRADPAESAGSDQAQDPVSPSPSTASGENPDPHGAVSDG